MGNIISKINKPKQVRNIPIDLLETEILPRLPIESLFRFKLVSKQWLAIISNPQFMNLLHLHRSTSSQGGTFLVETSNGSLYFLNLANYGSKSQDAVLHRQLNPYHGLTSRETMLVDSSKGLICLFIDDKDKFCFLNPATGVRREVISPKYCCPYKGPCLLAFGYSTPRDEYKLLYLNGFIEPKAYVYTLRSNDHDLRSWKELSVVSALRPYLFQFQSVGNIINEKAHWIVSKTITYGCGLCILAFDLTSETFNEVSFPQLSRQRNIVSTMIEDDCCCGVFFIDCIEQKLSFCRQQLKNDSCYLEVWMMMRYGVSESWSRIYNFDISPNPFSENEKCSNSYKITIEEGKLFFFIPNVKFVLLKDLKARQPSRVEVFDTDYVVKSTRTHVSSLVSPFLY